MSSPRRGRSTRSPRCPWSTAALPEVFRRGPVRLRAATLPAGGGLFLPRARRSSPDALARTLTRPQLRLLAAGAARQTATPPTAAWSIAAFASGTPGGERLAGWTQRSPGAVLKDLVRRPGDPVRPGSSLRPVDSVAAFRKAVPIRTYEALWEDYLRASYPVFDNLTWPGRIPYLALTSGTTEGPPSTSRSLARCSPRTARRRGRWWPLSSRHRARGCSTVACSSSAARPTSEARRGVPAGDLSGIAAIEVPRSCVPTLSRRSTWPSPTGTASYRGCAEPPATTDHARRRRAELAARLVPALLNQTGKIDRRGLADARAGRSRGREVRPLSRVVAVAGRPDASGSRRPIPAQRGSSPSATRRRASCAWSSTTACSTSSSRSTSSIRRSQPGTGWARRAGVNYAIVVSTCAGMWAHVIGDTVRFESLVATAVTFTGRTRYALSAFGEHLINEEVESAIASALEGTPVPVRDWHLGPVFSGGGGHHLLAVEFVAEPADLARFRDAVDRELCNSNADYQAHRTPGGQGCPSPRSSWCLQADLKRGCARWVETRRPAQSPSDGFDGQDHR